MEGEEKIAGTACPPWCAAYIAKTWPTGVTTNLSSCARYRLLRQLMSCAQLAIATFSGWRLKMSRVIPLNTASRRVGICLSISPVVALDLGLYHGHLSSTIC